MNKTNFECHKRSMRALGFACLLLPVGLMLSACAVNPVTGEQELSLVSEDQELEIGEESYDPMRQSSGGDYVADKALAAYVETVGKKLAKVSDRKLPYEFKVVNNTAINAWALPGGKIAINRGLLVELDNEAELAAVLGHEIVHAAARHGASAMTRGTLINLAAVETTAVAAQSDYSGQAELIGQSAVIAGTLFNFKYGRDAERESDHYGMKYMKRAGYDPRAAISLQKKFVALSKSEKKAGWLDALISSHPPSEERVNNNRKRAKKLGHGGEIGADRYQQAIAHLRSVQPAYDAYEQGRKALAASKLSTAESKARIAIGIEPNENQFHLLLGDILAKSGKNEAALQSYDEAARILPTYYAVYEKRGQLKKKMNDERGYREDMERAAKILPTAASYLALGRLSEIDGDSQSALEFYQAAAVANSLSGKTASREFSRLDRIYNPQNYLTGSVSVDKHQQLTVTVNNPLQQAVKHIDFTIEYGNNFFPKVAGDFNYSGTIDANGSVTLVTKLGPITKKQFKKNHYRVKFNQAQAVSE
jgi:predicted Zn-dependent protease